MTTRQLKFAIAVTAFALGVFAAILVLREPTIALTAETLAQARQRWTTTAIRSYDARYMMHSSLYEVRVRNGLVEEIKVNGRVPSIAQPGAYSIEGLFDTLEGEIENVLEAAGALPGGVIMRVRFDKTAGYPQYYVRSGSAGGRSVTIKMIHFQPVDK